MDNLKVLLNRQYGPVKVWYIVAALVAGVMVYFAYKSLNPSDAGEDDQATQSGEVPEDLETGEEEYVPGSGAYSAQLGGGGTYTYNPNQNLVDEQDSDEGADDEEDEQPNSNEDWLKLVAPIAASNSGTSTSDAYSILRKYLTGAQLSIQEGRVRDAAIGSKYGLPPSPPNNSIVLPDPAATTPTPAPVPVNTPIRPVTPATGNTLVDVGQEATKGGKSISTPSNTLKGPISMSVKANEDLASFQARVYNMYSFTPTMKQLENLNPSKPTTILKMHHGEKHEANELRVL